MTDLTLPLTACDDAEPYVIRLNTDKLSRTGGQVTISSNHGRAVLTTHEDLTDDIVAILPAQRRLLRLLRAGSNANTLLLTEECDQRCLMCSQPPRPRHHDDFTLYDQVIDLAPEGAIIGLSGGEPTLLGDRLLSWMRRSISRRPDIGFHLLTNGQHLTDRQGPDIAALAGHVLWGIPLYAARATDHDALVGKAGAYKRLLLSLDLLRKQGAVVELRTVVAQPTWPQLPRLAAFIGRHLPWIDHWAIMQLECRGFAKANWAKLFVDTGAHNGPLRTAATLAEVTGVPLDLFNFPRCTLPSEFRTLAVASISDWKQDFPAVCRSCQERDICGGFFTWQADRHGYTGVYPL